MLLTKGEMSGGNTFKRKVVISILDTLILRWQLDLQEETSGRLLEMWTLKERLVLEKELRTSHMEVTAGKIRVHGKGRGIKFYFTSFGTGF